DRSASDGGAGGVAGVARIRRAIGSACERARRGSPIAAGGSRRARAVARGLAYTRRRRAGDARGGDLAHRRALAEMGCRMPIEQSHDPKEFAAFALSGWDSTINGYDVALGSVARQTVAPMLDAVAVRPGWDVLDLCCGPGMLAAGALARGAKATGLDFSSAAV